MRTALLVLATALPLAAQNSRDAERLAYESIPLAQAGRLDDAIARIDEALAIPDLPPRFVAFLLLYRAEYLRFVRRDGEALADLARAESLLGERDDERRMLCNVAGLRGQIFLDRGLLDLAARAFATERERVDGLDDGSPPLPPERLAANVHGANLALAQEDWVGLEAWIDEVLSDPRYDVESLRAERAKFRVRLAYGLIELEQNDPDRPRRARDILVEALADLEHQPVERARPALMLVELSLREGDTEQARAWLDVAESTLGPTEVRTSSPDYPLWVALSGRHARHTSAADDTLAAWRSTLQSVWDDFLASWAETPPRPGGYGPLQFADTRLILSELVELVLRTEPPDGAAERALGEVLRVQALGTLARRADADVPHLAEVRDELLRGDDHGLLVYLPSHGTSHVFALDGRDLTHHVLARDDEIEWARAALLRHILRGGTTPDDDRELRQRLAALVLPPSVAARISRWSRLTLVGVDLLGTLPFEALPLADHERLGAALAVDRLPTVPVGMAVVRRSPPDEVPIDVRLLFAPELSESALALAPALPELPADGARAHRILAAYDDDARDVFRASAATYGALSNEGRRPRVLQLLTHAVHDARRERPAALALSAATADDDGLLWADEIEGLSPPELVVLTACRAGRAPLRRGDPGAADLGGAFLMAGARAVVLSDFDLELRMAEELSERLHRGLVAGRSPAESLRAARAELLAEAEPAERTRICLPYVSGLGHVPVFAGRAATEPATAIDDVPAKDEGPASDASRGPPPTWVIAAVVAALVSLVWSLLTRRRR